MLPVASRIALREAPRLRTLHSRRLLSTAPPHQKSRSWKSSAARWGIAIGGLYYYNTSSVFAEEPPFSPSLAHATTPEETSYPTLDSIAPTRRPRSSGSLSPASSTASPTTAIAEDTSGALDDPRPGGLEETEEEASQEGAFNEETGEINWDCPCLGGMAHGPCGEEFRAAFSCFVFSKDEPKGMDCIDRFKGMQDCFRLHPDDYPEELADPGPPEDDEPAIGGAVDAAVGGVAEDLPVSSIPKPSDSPSISSLSEPSKSSGSGVESRKRTPPPDTLTSPIPSDADIHPSHTTNDDDKAKNAKAKTATEQVRRDHETGGQEELVPKEWHDTRQKNDAQ